MSLRNWKVRVFDGILMIDAEEYLVDRGGYEPVHREVPLEFAVLSTPDLGPRGGFLGATLTDSRRKDEPYVYVWNFFRGHRELYNKVAETLRAEALVPA